MALRLEFASVIVPRHVLSRCSDLPEFFGALHPGGGVLMDLLWYDPHLFREGSMSFGDAGQQIDTWASRGLIPLRIHGGRKTWRDVCLVASHKGPTLPCDWLEFDPAENCVWLKGTERGPVIGGSPWVAARMELLATLEAEAGRASTAMHGSRHPKVEFDRAMTALDEAVELARFLHQGRAEERLKGSGERIRTALESQKGEIFG